MSVASFPNPSSAIALRSASAPIGSDSGVDVIPEPYTSFSSVARNSSDDAPFRLVYRHGMSTIHKRIKQRREELGLSQGQLAEALGVKYQTVQQWEKDPEPGVLSTAPKRTRMAEVAGILGVTETWLRTGMDDDGAKSDPIEQQLLGLYRELTPELQEALLQQANGLYIALNPEKRNRGNPYSGKKPPAKE